MLQRFVIARHFEWLILSDTKLCQIIERRETANTEPFKKMMLADKQMASMESFSDVLTVTELAHILRVGRNTAYNIVKSGDVKSIRVRSQIRIPKTSIIEYLGNNNGKA